LKDVWQFHEFIPLMGCPARREQQGEELKSSQAGHHAVLCPVLPCVLQYVSANKGAGT